MRALGLVIAGSLAVLGGCKKSSSEQPAPEAAVAVAAEPTAAPGEVEAADPLSPRESDPGFDAIAEGVAIDTVTPGVIWLGPDAVREILFALAAGAWTLEPTAGGVALRVGAASRLAARMGLSDGDVLARLNDLELRGAADARPAMMAFAGGDRVRVAFRRDGVRRELLVRVVDAGGESTRARVDDIVAAGLHDAPEPAIERAVLVGLGSAERVLVGRPELVLELFGLPGEASDISLGGASVAREDLARMLGAAASGDRIELVAGGVTFSRKIVSGAIEASDLEHAIVRLAPARRSPPSEVGGPPGELDPGLDEVEPAIEGLERIDESHVRVTRELVESWFGDPATLAKAARIVPSMKDGATDGFKLYAIRRGSPARALGFRNGDKITAIAGRPLTGVDAAMETYSKLRKAKKVTVELERKGVSMTMEIEVVE